MVSPPQQERTHHMQYLLFCLWVVFAPPARLKGVTVVGYHPARGKWPVRTKRFLTTAHLDKIQNRVRVRTGIAVLLFVLIVDWVFTFPFVYQVFTFHFVFHYNFLFPR